MRHHTVSERLIMPLALVLVAACGSGPLAPKLVAIGTSEPYALVANCHNVARDQALTGLITDAYLTTWGGVYGEVWKSKTPLDQPIAEGGSSILFRMPAEKTFCMAFDAHFDDVIQAVEDTRGLLGIEFITAKRVSGEYETDYALRSAKFGPTQWKEKYLIFVSAKLGAGTDVRVYREVLISRETEDAGQGRQFYESTSVGHNEAWYLLQLRSRLNGAAM